MVMADHTSDASNPPEVPQDSVGSSVSSRFQDEYEELLKYAVVVPKIDIAGLPNVLPDSKRPFVNHPSSKRAQDSYKTDGDSNCSSDTSPRRPPPQRSSQAAQMQRPSVMRHEPERQTERSVEETDEPDSPQQPRQHWRAAAPPSPSPRPQRVHELGGLQSPLLFSAGAGADGGPDDDIRTMESKLDLWCRDLKTNIVEEVARMKIKLMEQNRHTMEQTSYQHDLAMHAKQNDLEGMKELLHTYEVSIDRKDSVIANLTCSLENQKEKFDVLRNFTEWKLQFYSHKQEGYATRLALKHNRLTQLRKAWRSWHVIIEEKWRQRVEKACQAKAQEVCIALTNDYETKMASVNEALEGARSEVEKLHKERDMYEESMKKAFMRGVCALNLEAMNIFHEASATDSQEPANENADPLHNLQGPLIVQQEPVYAVEGSTGARPNHHGHRQPLSLQGRHSTFNQQRTAAAPPCAKTPVGTKQFSARLVAKTDSTGDGGSCTGRVRPEGLSGPGQVLVERHHEAATDQQHNAAQQQRSTTSASLKKGGAGSATTRQVSLPVTKTVKIVK